MKFAKLFSIEIKHGYFEEGVCSDLLILPTAECSRLLKNNKLLFNNTRKGTISVFAGADNGDKLFTPPDISFDFSIFLLNPDFVSYSSLPGKKADEVYFFTTKNADINDKSLLIASLIKSQSKTAAANKPLFGLIQIILNKTLPAAYTIHFEAAETKWRYYLLANSNSKNLTINGALAGIDFSQSKQSGNGQPDQIASSINDNYPGAEVVVFESVKAIPYNKRGKKDIQLINTDKNNILINHLPNPAFTDNGIKIINIIN